jgi:uncharacterized membrane protein YbhN (UPF0104 family)
MESSFRFSAALYTRHYKWHQGVSNAMIGAFYNDVTPGASGGQVMQVYTMKKQGIEISNAASIMVMWFIHVSGGAMIFFDILAIIFQWDTIMAIKSFQIPNFSLFGWDGTDLNAAAYHHRIRVEPFNHRLALPHELFP